MFKLALLFFLLLPSAEATIDYKWVGLDRVNRTPAKNCGNYLSNGEVEFLQTLPAPLRMDPEQFEIWREVLSHSENPRGTYLSYRAQIAKLKKQGRADTDPEIMQLEDLARDLFNERGAEWTPTLLLHYADIVFENEAGIPIGAKFKSNLAYRSFLQAGGRGVFEEQGLYVLDLSEIGLEGIDLFMLRTWGTLTELNVGGNQINLPRARALAHITGLKKLWVYNCSLTPMTASILASMPNLEEINVTGNRLENGGIQVFATASPSLKRLEARGNWIDDDGLEVLLTNPAFTFLDLSHNSITQNGVRMLESSPTIKGWKLEGTPSERQPRWDSGPVSKLWSWVRKKFSK